MTPLNTIQRLHRLRAITASYSDEQVVRAYRQLGDLARQCTPEGAIVPYPLHNPLKALVGEIDRRRLALPL